MIYGYARVSTDGQSIDAQARQFRTAGAEKIFKETASGVKTAPSYAAPSPRSARCRRPSWIGLSFA